MRWNHTPSLQLRSEPGWLILPRIHLVTFGNKEQPLIAMSYYAVHPVTFFGEGIVSTDFVGLARDVMEKRHQIPQIYFTGAAGNIGVGKYNDGSIAIRQILASRIARATEEALNRTVRSPVEMQNTKWKYTDTYLPLASFLKKDRDRKSTR